MNRIEIINRLKSDNHITQEEFEILLSNDQRLKYFQVWKVWKYDESILLDSEQIENLKKLQ